MEAGQTQAIYEHYFLRRFAVLLFFQYFVYCELDTRFFLSAEIFQQLNEIAYFDFKLFCFNIVDTLIPHAVKFFCLITALILNFKVKMSCLEPMLKSVVA